LEQRYHRQIEALYAEQLPAAEAGCAVEQIRKNGVVS